jgi:DNA-binding protein HU-beta
MIEEGTQLNKTELVGAVAEKAGLTKKDADRVVNSLFEVITETLASGEKVQIIGFGTFEVRHRAARKGRNPQTGEEIDIAASRLPAFKAGKALRRAVDE